MLVGMRTWEVTLLSSEIEGSSSVDHVSGLPYRPLVLRLALRDCHQSIKSATLYRQHLFSDLLEANIQLLFGIAITVFLIKGLFQPLKLLSSF